MNEKLALEELKKCAVLAEDAVNASCCSECDGWGRESCRMCHGSGKNGNLEEALKIVEKLQKIR